MGIGFKDWAAPDTKLPLPRNPLAHLTTRLLLYSPTVWLNEGVRVPHMRLAPKLSVPTSQLLPRRGFGEDG